MDGSPPPSEGAEESTAREDDETQEVSETPEVSEAQEVFDTQVESEEIMEVGYAEAAAAYGAAAYHDPTPPEFSSGGETDGETVGQEGHNVSHDRACHQ